MCASAARRDDGSLIRGVRFQRSRPRLVAIVWTPSRHASALMTAAGFCLAISGCGGPPVASRLTIFNANPHAIAVNLTYYSEPFSIAACGTAEFTWESTWRQVSGIGVPGGSEPQVFVYSRGPGADQGPAHIVDIVSGDQYIEYPRSWAPSLPPCSAPVSSDGTSG